MTSPIDPGGQNPWDAAPAWDGVDPWAQAPAPPTGAVPPAAMPGGHRGVRRRPILMGFAGLLGGLGVAMLLVHFAKIALGTNAPLLVIAIGAALGVALAYTLPPRSRRAPKRP